ncbi:Protein arginine N-methyltransferase 1 [Perkinsus olseni]|uniref:type I protein arginine methyltransferase n=1 Tax=Perkinsus olseni TaxID=32597 RepID=A0A7J6ME63_PEROL|nr:Protein arginine N-methyltransferase 1 [Perkinsus olseni]KAF4675077.1 Protein arginine N-methyltransferase 1 [Perkinsus olseni]
MSSSSSSPRRASHESMPSHTAVGPTAPSMLHNPRSLRGIKRSYSGHDSRHVTSPRRLLRSRHRLHYDDEDYLTAATAATTATSSPVPSVGGGAPSTPDTSSVSPLRTWAQEWARSGNVLEDDPLYRLQNNDYYYNSYGKLEIHEEMLGDEVRTGTYRRAILDNAPLFEGKTVLDIGSGTGILSLFAAQAGAKHVYGIECSEIVDVARTIATANGLGDRITYIRGEVEDIELPVDEVDIIVSEWMGYCLLYEAMLDSVLYARDKWLAADGYMLPDRAYLYVAGINGWEDLDDRKHFWDSVGGVRMSCVKEELSTEPVVTDVDTDNVCTATACVLELDLYSCTSSDLQFVTQLRLPSTRRDLVTGLVIWFDVAFTFGNDPVAMVYTMTTGPDSTPTHWQQTVIYFDHFCPLAHSEYMSKDTLECTLGIRKSQWNPRNLDIKIVYHAQTTPDPLDGLAATDTTSAVHTKMYRMS